MSPDLFRGSRVRLCAPRAEDAETLSRWSEDAQYRRLADTDAPRPLAPDHFRDRDEAHGEDPNNFEFRIRALDDDRLLGFVAVVGIEWPNRHGWVAIGLGDPAERARGFGTEAMGLVLRYAFHELGLHRVSLDVIADNQPAIALYRSLGFIEEGRLRERVLRDGQRTDLLYMGLLARDWELSRQAAAGET